MPPGVPTERGSSTPRVRAAVSSLRARRTSRACGPLSLTTMSYVTRSPSPRLGEPVGQRPDVDEHIGVARIGGDEPEAFVRVVPGHGAVRPVGCHGLLGGLVAQGQQMVSLRSLLPVDDEERHPLPLRDHATRHDGRTVHEDLGTPAIGRDEAVPLGRLVPGYGAEHAQRCIGGLVGRDPDVACLRAAVPLADLELNHLPLPEQASSRRR